MSTKPKIVCLCGSTRFWQTFHDVGWIKTLDGEIVLSVGVCKHVDEAGGHGAEQLGPDVVRKLDELHFRKIDMADYVMVLNVGGYIGKSTAREIMYALHINTPVCYLEPCTQAYLELETLADAAEAECPVWNRNAAYALDEELEDEES